MRFPLPAGPELYVGKNVVRLVEGNEFVTPRLIVTDAIYSELLTGYEWSWPEWFKLNRQFGDVQVLRGGSTNTKEYLGAVEWRAFVTALGRQ